MPTLSCRKSILSCFPESSIHGGNMKGYVVTVVSDRGNVVAAEYGLTRQLAWNNAYNRIYEIYSTISRKMRSGIEWPSLVPADDCRQKA